MRAPAAALAWVADAALARLAARRTAAALAFPAALCVSATALLSASTEAACTLWVVLGLPLGACVAARTAREWRTRELDWIAARPASPALLLRSWWLGAWAAGASFTLLVSVLAATLAGSRPNWVERARCEHAGGLLVGRDALRLPVELPGSAGPRRLAVRARTAVLRARSGGSSGPAVVLRLRLRSDAGREISSARRALSGRGWLELDVPAGAGAHELEIARAGEGPAVSVPRDSLRVLERHDSALPGAWRTGVRLALLLGAWQAVALCLGVWLSPATAAVGTWSLWLPLWNVDARGVPGAEVWGLLTSLGQGVAPAAPGATYVALWGGLLALALLVGRSGLTPWKRGVT